MLSRSRVLAVLVLIALTWYAMHNTAGVQPVPIKKSLSSFPHTIGDYTLSSSFQSSSEVLEMLGVDNYIQYNYINSEGRRINLYVGYYRAVGVTGTYHSPRNCIPGGGWGIESVESRSLDAGLDGAKSSTIASMLIRNGNAYQVVYYWYQNRGKIIGSEYAEKIYQVLDAITMGRRDGTFVRVMSAVVDQDMAATEKEMKKFSELVMQDLENYLPGAKL
ncbi:MAG: exosortase C-terminal domain/associated protein EpsI [Desulfopila sp.]